MTAINMISVL